MKAISLLSGGLDSILAAKLIRDQGVSVEAVNFITGFCSREKKNSQPLSIETMAARIGASFKAFDIAKEYFEIVKNPRYGYGSNINPCIDCKIFMFKKAKEYMEQTGGCFVISGEVLGQRPMSQKINSLNLIENKSGLKGLLVRPLSAKLLDPSIPEEKGWIDREKLLSISGRGRKMQMELARQFGIKEYKQPAGGCLLTDEGFANRLKDLMQHNDNIDTADVNLLKYGRHFRVSPNTKIVVGRNEEENKIILNLAKEKDLIFDIPALAGPIVLLRGEEGQDVIKKAAMITAHYSDGSNQKRQIQVSFWQAADTRPENITVPPIEAAEIEKIRI